MNALRRNRISAEQVAYAAVTYAKAKGVAPDQSLFVLKSEAQMTLAAALYDAFPDVVFHRVASALQCPKDESNRLNMMMRGRRKAGRGIDEAVIRNCRIAAVEPTTARTELPSAAIITGVPRVPIIRTTAPPPEPRFPPQSQIRKPMTDLDKEIYGEPLNRRSLHAFKPAIVENVTAALMGDPEPRQ